MLNIHKFSDPKVILVQINEEAGESLKKLIIKRKGYPVIDEVIFKDFDGGKKRRRKNTRKNKNKSRRRVNY